MRRRWPKRRYRCWAHSPSGRARLRSCVVRFRHSRPHGIVPALFIIVIPLLSMMAVCSAFHSCSSSPPSCASATAFLFLTRHSSRCFSFFLYVCATHVNVDVLLYLVCREACLACSIRSGISCDSVMNAWPGVRRAAAVES